MNYQMKFVKKPFSSYKIMNFVSQMKNIKDFVLVFLIIFGDIEKKLQKFFCNFFHK